MPRHFILASRNNHFHALQLQIHVHLDWNPQIFKYKCTTDLDARTMLSIPNNRRHSMKPSGNLPADLAKMDDWAISYGAYSRSTVERAKRRLKQLGKSIDLYNLDQESLQSYVSTRLRRGATESAFNHEFKDLRVWIRYRNLDVALPHLKEARTPEAWFPTDDEMERIIAAAGRSPDKSVASRDT